MSDVPSVKALDARFADMVSFIRAVSSDTTAAETMTGQIKEYRAALKEQWEIAMFDNAVYDNFMVYTETQRKRRMSGEFAGAMSAGVICE